ncbi:MAG: hypothetical protein A2V90_05990 [Gammaproteobacteria bacterium RBG_16_57_12]|nr:MAG: hypothetical protein A2V90_05990 [Gammaproteobacteria bacterium RBG_16_57_12]
MITKVLIVDDSAMSRKIIRKALPHEWEVTISEAADGSEALVAYQAGKADVMFLDLTMPNLDGFAVLEALKKQEAKVCVFVVSADIQPKAHERVISLGAMAFIKKPVDAEILKNELKKAGLI